jgi:MoaA/NifB/PqqE/SkfB family radical SAM enzyme
MLSEVNSLEILEIHPGIGCDLNCVRCFRQGATYELVSALIPKDCLKKLIDDFATQGGRQLIISGGLEPFSNPQLVYLLILWAFNAGLKVKVYTNGVSKVLSEPRLQNILAFRTKQVRFSIHAIKPHTYHLITRTNQRSIAFYDVFRNVKALMEARPKVDGTKVGIGFLALSENINELVEAAEFWCDMGIDFFDLRFDCATELNNNKKISYEVSHFCCLTDLGHFFPMRINIGDHTYGKPCFASRCCAIFRKLVVDPFGLVWACCLQAQPGYRPAWAKLGDLKSDCLSNIIKRIREKFPRPHCKQCTPWEAKCNLWHEQMSSVKSIRTASADSLKVCG